ncbi:MAG: site-specific integrase [Coriobacteriia bacterium]|nr:site-specific integrase [Coriobacteriia bacterium]
MGKRGGKLSGTTTRAYFNLASQVFKDAWRKRLIAENPFERLTPPKRDTKPRELIPLPELRRIMNAAQSSYHAKFEEFEAKELRMERLPKSSQRSSVLGLMQLSCPLVVLVAFSTGIRISEALGLTWGCVKPNTCDSILIRQSLDCDGKTLTAPKTKAGNRKLDVPETIAPYLVEWHGIQCRALKSLGIEVNRDTPVFCSNVGGFIDQGNYGTWRKSFIKEKGLRPFGMHDLRHAWASHLLANGLDLKRAQKLIGHSSPDCLARTYAHAVDDGRERAALIIDGVLEEMAV